LLRVGLELRLLPLVALLLDLLGELLLLVLTPLVDATHTQLVLPHRCAVLGAERVADDAVRARARRRGAVQRTTNHKRRN